MHSQIKALIVNDESILVDGRELAGIDEVANALKTALEQDPDLILVIEPAQDDDYKAIGTVIYASQRAGVPVENLRFTLADGDVVPLDELRARNSRSSG